MVTAVILAGGKSRRMGRDKLTLPIGGSTLLELAVERFSTVFEDVCISVADESKYREISVGRIADILPGAGPLSGLHAALSLLRCDGVFLVAADLPYADPLAAKRVIELGKGSEATVIRLPDGKIEPLFGYYGKALLERCRSAIQAGSNRMTELLNMANTRYLSIGEPGELWDEKLIVNINRPEDFSKAAIELSGREC